MEVVGETEFLKEGILSLSACSAIVESSALKVNVEKVFFCALTSDHFIFRPDGLLKQLFKKENFQTERKREKKERHGSLPGTE